MQKSTPKIQRSQEKILLHRFQKNSILWINMIQGIGVDILEKRRVDSALKRWGDRFLQKILTVREIEILRHKGDFIGSVAVRFAAKEAVFKALGMGWSKKLGWHDVEILNSPEEKPQLVFSARVREWVKGTRVHVSLSHSMDYAIAMVIIELEE